MLMLQRRVTAVFVNFAFLSHAFMSKSVYFDFARAQGDAVQCRGIKIRSSFNGLQSFLTQVGFFFSIPDLHWITVVRINIFGWWGNGTAKQMSV